MKREYRGAYLETYERRLGTGAKRNTPGISDEELRRQSHKVRGKALMGLGIDGMPLARGQTGPQTEPAGDAQDELARLEAERCRMIQEHCSGRQIMAVCDKINELRRRMEDAAGN